MFPSGFNHLFGEDLPLPIVNLLKMLLKNLLEQEGNGDWFRVRLNWHFKTENTEFSWFHKQFTWPYHWTCFLRRTPGDSLAFGMWEKLRESALNEMVKHANWNDAIQYIDCSSIFCLLWIILELQYAHFFFEFKCFVGLCVTRIIFFTMSIFLSRKREDFVEDNINFLTMF